MVYIFAELRSDHRSWDGFFYHRVSLSFSQSFTEFALRSILCATLCYILCVTLC